MRKWILSLAVLVASPSWAQTVIHNQLVNTQNGPVSGLFEVAGGSVTPINTGLASNLFPSLSPDGNFITISAADPNFPNEASDDLWEYNRATGQTRQVINNETITQPNGSIFFASPLFSALSPNNQIIAVSTQLGAVPTGGVALPRILTVHNASDGFTVATAETGQGSTFDTFQSEFLGISWSPTAPVFATSAYVPVTSNLGRSTAAAGIVLYGFNASLLTWERVGQITTPEVFDAPGVIVIETHAFPVYSPNGQRLAFFSITYPDPLLTSGAFPELFTVNADGSGLSSVLAFNQGFYPLGLSWTPNGNQLAFSIAEQVQSGGFFSPLGDPATAVLRLISVSGGQPSPIPGAPSGFFPNVVPVPEPGFALGLAACAGALAGLARRRKRDC